MAGTEEDKATRSSKSYSGLDPISKENAQHLYDPVCEYNVSVLTINTVAKQLAKKSVSNELSRS